MNELKVILTPELEQFITCTFNKDVTAEGDVKCYGRFEYTRKATDPEHQYTATHIDANLLPSRFQINSVVNVIVGSHVRMPNCKVIKTHFTESKVLYDVELPYEYDTPDHIRLGGVTRLYNIDSCFVEPAE